MRKLVVCALLGLAACGRGVDPNDPTAMVSPLALEPPPIYSLLGYRSDLDLTSAQVSALDSIAQMVDDSTRDAVSELRRSSASNSRYRGRIPITDSARPLLEQVRGEHREATEAVQEVLTDEQEAAVCRLYEPSREERERMEARQARGVSPAVADSLFLLRGGFWGWCGGDG